MSTTVKAAQQHEKDQKGRKCLLKVLGFRSGRMILVFLIIGSISTCQGFLTSTIGTTGGVSNNLHNIRLAQNYPQNLMSRYGYNDISEHKLQQERCNRRGVALFVAIDPTRDTASKGISPYRNRSITKTQSNNNWYRTIERQNNKKKPQFKNNKSLNSGCNDCNDDEENTDIRWQAAVEVEEKIMIGLDQMKSDFTKSIAMLFPSGRECNLALATFGDKGELLRALRLFVKMRKAASLAKFAEEKYNTLWLVPAPTLVTYSTLMSRAVKTGKPLVALRLWLLMKNEAGFRLKKTKFNVAATTTSEVIIIPDVKAANILMNAYAKLSDVESAEDLLLQMMAGNGSDVPQMTPNLVTYNTLLDACHKAEDLNKALEAKNLLLESGIRPDARTYTTLIATVARNNDYRQGANDPSLAFSLLEEMNAKRVRPNGMTYSALIDVCGRCKQSDLAINGLRVMLQQKQKEEKAIMRAQQLEPEHHTSRSTHKKTKNSKNKNNNCNNEEQYSLSNEVGAWTAAIDACGKSGGIETAIRLFYSMPKFGVQPNTITCGCLTDCLLRNGRVSEALDVLQYMEYQGIAPSEVMYTSLITSAAKLVELENKKKWQYEKRLRQKQAEAEAEAAVDEQDTKRTNSTEFGMSSNSGEDKAIKVYTELMKSVMRGTPKRVTTAASTSTTTVDLSSNKSPNKQTTKWITKGDEEESTTLLFKVFLIYQEMKAAGAKPDLACYNALLRACARAGDIGRSQDVMDQIRSSGLDPDDRSWREMIRTAGKARRSDVAESIWEAALDYRGSNDEHKKPVKWVPSVETFCALVFAYLRHASSLDPNTDQLQRQSLYEKVVFMYKDILEVNDRLGADMIDENRLHENKRTMLMVLRAVVVLEDTYCSNNDSEKQELMRDTGKFIISLECLYEGFMSKDRATKKALKIASSW